MNPTREFLPLAERRALGMAGASILGGAAWMTMLLAPQVLAGPPMIIGPTEPGPLVGKFTSYWAAPRVRISQETAGKTSTMTATWYSEEGVASTRRSGSVQPGFITVLEDGQVVHYGTNEPWRIVTPKDTGPGFGPDAKGKIKSMAGITRSTPDSRVLVRQFCPRGGEIALEIYVHGQATPTIGPFTQYLGRSEELGEDGSTAMLVWKDDDEKIPQLVVTDSSGKLSFRIDCEATDRSPMPGPDGVGAIVPERGASAHRDWYAWYTREGKARTLELSQQPYVIAWLPGTQRSLCFTTIGYDRRFEMIDWETGRKIWDVPCPGGFVLASGTTPKLLILSVAELYKGGPWAGDGRVLENGRTEFIRAFYALNVDDGGVVARWQAKYPSRWSGQDRDSFLRLGQKLYFMTMDEVIEMREDDILLGKGGWDRSAAVAK